MNELRWILLIAGIAVLAAIYVFGRKEQLRRRRRRREEEETMEDTAGLSFSSRSDDEDLASAPQHHFQGLQETLAEDTDWHAPRPVTPAQPVADPTPAKKPSPPRPQARNAAVRQPLSGDKIISFYVVARRPGVLRGDAIRRAVEETELQYGEMQIFNKVIERSGKRHIVFSLANAVPPGTFDLDDMRSLTTPGLALFMQLPGPMEGLKAFNLMLDCAQRVARELDAELLDETRSVLSNQTIDHMREEVQLFSLRTARARNRVP